MLMDVNGIRLNYKVHGTGDPVLLLSGFGANHRFWRDMVELLDDHACVVIDNRGVGLTEFEGEFTLDDIADDAVMLMEELGYPRMHVVGWSMGSHIAQSLASRYPDRVRTLTLVSTYMRRPARSAYFLNGLTRMACDGRASVDALYHVVNAFCFTEKYFSECESEGRSPPIPRSPADPEKLLMQLRSVDGFDPAGALPRIKAPTLVVQGSDDIMTDFSEGEAVSSAIEGSSLYRVEGIGHTIPASMYVDRLREHMMRG